jgi:hypothetical protein
MDHAIINVRGSRRGSPGPLGRLLAGMAFGRSRRRLGDLDDHLLRDIGLTRAQARQEATRPAWNAPTHWLR